MSAFLKDSVVSESYLNKSEEECVLLKSVAELRDELICSPNIYDKHVQLISSLRKLGNSDELRTARENMSSIYPLTPSLWLEWIQDERAIVTSPSEVRQVDQLFTRALEDYEDVNIWLEYCQFIIGNVQFDSCASVSYAEEVFERALAHQGLNIANGSVLWEVYREFLFVLVAQSDKKLNAESSETYLRQIDKLFRRQLSIPLLNMESSLTEYVDFLRGMGSRFSSCSPDASNEKTLISSDCLADYEKAISRLHTLLPFEECVEASSKESEERSVASWLTYLDWAVQSTRKMVKSEPGSSKQKSAMRQSVPIRMMPNEVCCLFERAVTAHCLYQDIWLRFVNYLEDELSSDQQRLLTTLARSVRNCPWSVHLWLRYALVSESFASENNVEVTANTNGNDNAADTISASTLSTFATVEALFETAINAGFEHSVDLCRIWMAYCDHHIRRLLVLPNSTKDWINQLYNVRSTFDRALDDLFGKFGSKADSDGSLLQFYATVEAKHCGDMGRARTLWSRLMQLPGNGSQARFWLAYLLFERNWGDTKHFLRVSNMAINSISDDQPELVFQSILRLACELGVPLDRYRDLERRVRHRCHALQLQEAPSDVTEKTSRPSQVTKSNRIDPARGKRKLNQTASSTDVFKKPKLNQQATDVSDGHIQLGTDVHVERQSTNFSSHFDHASSKDESTVFVSNLDYSVTEEQLQSKFASCGDLTSIRLVKNFAGRSKGYAYVEFRRAEDATNALKLDRSPIELPSDSATLTEPSKPLRPMFVSVCDASRQKASTFRYSSGHQEPEKLFVRNLDRTVSKEQLENFFSSHGDLVSVRLVTYRNGASKGHAYIEFRTADEASRALVSTDGALLGSKHISVVISNPPIREHVTDIPTVDESTHSVERCSKIAKLSDIPTGYQQFDKQRTHSRARLEFMPRAVYRCSSTTNSFQSQSGYPSSDTSVIPKAEDRGSKTNEDFRKLFKL